MGTCGAGFVFLEKCVVNGSVLGARACGSGKEKLGEERRCFDRDGDASKRVVGGAAMFTPAVHQLRRLCINVRSVQSDGGTPCVTGAGR